MKLLVGWVSFLRRSALMLVLCGLDALHASEMGGCLTQNEDELCFQDAVAFVHGSAEKPSLSVTLFPFPLTEEELAELQSQNAAYALIQKAENPDPELWPACPYIRLDIEFEAGRGISVESIASYHFVISATVHANVSFVIDEKGPAARKAFEGIRLTTEDGKTGTLELEFAGQSTQVHDTQPRSPRTFHYTWNVSGRCRAYRK